MPFEVSWLVDKRVVYLRSFGVVTPEELPQSAETILEWLDTGDAPVHIIVDHSEIDKLPLSAGFSNGTVFPQPHPNAGWITLVSGSVLSRFAVSVITKMNHTEMKAFSTLDEAIRFLQRIDLTLPAEIVRS